MYKTALVFTAVLFFVPALIPQQTSKPVTQKTAYSAIPVEAAKQTNPIKSSPESLARAKKWYGFDCTMCHGKEGDGKGDTAKDMKLQVADLTNPDTLKDRTDGEIFYVIQNGHQDMPGEGARLKADDYWDLVNYVRSLVKGKAAETKPQ